MARVSIEEALDDCLQRLPHEGLDACLRRYPEYAAELRGLLQVGTMVSRTSAATVLSDAARQRMRAQLFQAAPATTANPVVPRQPAGRAARALPTMPIYPGGRGALWQRPLVRVALALLILAALFVGTGTASAHALPGDAFYPVKRLYEGIRYTFSLSDNDKANARLDFASARLDEMEALFQRKSTIDADLFSDLDDNVSYCNNELNSNNFSAKPQLATALGALLQREQQVMGTVGSAVSANAQSLYTTTRQSIAQYYQVVTRYAPSAPPLATPTGLPLTSPSVTPSLPAAQDTATPSPNAATPSDTVVLTGTIAVPTDTPLPVTDTPVVPPSPTNAGRPRPTNTPVSGTPLPRPSNTPLPPHPTPTPRPPTNTPTPAKLKPTLTPTVTVIPVLLTRLPPLPAPTVTLSTATGDTQSKGNGKGKGKVKGKGGGGSDRGGDGG